MPVKWLITLLFGGMLTFCSHQATLLEQIQAQGELHVVTRHSPTTYFLHADGTPRGVEYELVHWFAQELGVKLKLTVVDDITQVLPLVVEGKVHFAAAGLAVNTQHQTTIHYAARYQTLRHQLVYHQRDYPPVRRWDALNGAQCFTVAKGSDQARLLKQLQNQHLALFWHEQVATPTALVKQLYADTLHYTLLADYEVLRLRQLYPELRVALALPTTTQLAWAFPRMPADDSLYLAALRFIHRLQHNGELERLLEHYYGHIESPWFTYVDRRTFYQHVETRLPQYRHWFERSAARYQFDWRVLAALSYQESHWNADAVSPTGVRGLMMLTEVTANEMKIVDRTEPQQSIEGGTGYLLKLYNRFNATIPEPDRLWFALAAYNVGYGHVQDARQLTRYLDGHPDRWKDVKRYLPLLRQPKWHAQTQHGYARGDEAVRYVTNIRRYFDMLQKVRGGSNHNMVEKNTLKQEKIVLH